MADDLELTGSPDDKSAMSVGETLQKWLDDHASEIKLPKVAVCEGHHSPWECLTAIRDRPPVALILGSRGSGKSFLSALDTHLTSREHPKQGTRILGGSKAQSEQIYRALREIATDYEGELGTDADSIAKMTRDGATYANGSDVSILAASSTSVRGPHVASLKLDEVDEMKNDIRESAMGMCMGTRPKKEREAVAASVIMTSTCHRVDGSMSRLIKQAEEGDFPLYTMCVFEVLERCDEKRSGGLWKESVSGSTEIYEKCPTCPIMRYCHDVPADQPLPKAKRSDGHYPIDSLIQKLKTTSLRTFEADYLCKLSSSEAAWFPDFQPETHVSELAEYLPGTDVHLAVDTGVFTGAVLFHLFRTDTKDSVGDTVHVFADYLSEGKPAQVNARAIRELATIRGVGFIHSISTDPAGGSRNPVGDTVINEYFRGGLALKSWPMTKVADSLALLESFISPAEGTTKILVHPRCVALISALRSYERAKKNDQWLDRPKDPQHPAEDLVDALRGGLRAAYPDGRGAKAKLRRVLASKVL